MSVLVACTSVAFAHADQEGWQAKTRHADGSYAEVIGNGFSAKAHQCAIYSVVTVNIPNHRQIESGLVRCNGANIDGTCPGGHVFVEVIGAGGKTCTPGFKFTNNTGYDATTYRNSPTSKTFTGHINGATDTQGGFGLKGKTFAVAWAEATGGTRCPAPSQGHFRSWERYNTSSGWHYPTHAHRHRAPTAAIPESPCWYPYGLSATGNFRVD